MSALNNVSGTARAGSASGAGSAGDVSSAGKAKTALKIGDLELKNPFTVASGTFAFGLEYAQIWQSAAEQVSKALGGAFNVERPLTILGALTTKGLSQEPWEGNAGIRIAESPSGVLNSIGLQNPGVEEFCQRDLPWLAAQEVPVIINVSGHSADEYVSVIERLEKEDAVSAYEVNISCPNVDCGGMAFGTDTKAAAEVTQRCRAATKRTLIIKLTPNVTDISEIARACEAHGADALSLINTVAGMAIDAKTREAVFDRKVAGLSGPAIKPIALYAIYRSYQAVQIPLIGGGGLTTVEDAVEFLLAGASALSVGTLNFTHPLALPALIGGLEQWLKENGVADVKELIGGLR